MINSKVYKKYTCIINSFFGKQMESNVGYSITSTATVPWGIQRRIILEENVDSLNSVISRKVSFEISKPNGWFVNSVCEKSVSINPNYTEGFNHQQTVHSEVFPNNVNPPRMWNDEPMEVDCFDTNEKEISANGDAVLISDNFMKDKANSLTLNETEVRLRKKLVLNAENQNKLSREVVFVPKNSSKLYRYLCIVTFFVIFLSVWIFFPSDMFYKNDDLQLENLKSEFKELVFGQQNAVSTILKTLENMNHWQSKLKMLAFVGGMGVGKTFIANILKQHFPENLVHDVNFAQLKSKMFEKKLNSCCSNLIIVDNLQVSDLYDVTKFIETLPKDQFLLVIAIFSVQETEENLVHKINYNDVGKVQKAFDKSDLFYELIEFDVITKNIIEEWLSVELHKRNVPKESYSRIFHFVLKNEDVAQTGFKRMPQKLLLATKMYDN